MQYPSKDNPTARNVETPRPPGSLAGSTRANTVSETVLASLQELVDRANTVRGLTQDRLHPFTYPGTEEVPEESNFEKEPPQISYPPFYATVRDACGEVSRALAEVEKMLNAAEL